MALHTLSLHDALPIFARRGHYPSQRPAARPLHRAGQGRPHQARRRRVEEAAPAGASADGAIPVRQMAARSEEHTLNSSHLVISYAVFCLKTKKILQTE